LKGIEGGEVRSRAMFWRPGSALRRRRNYVIGLS
jgi:hypothetical protein